MKYKKKYFMIVLLTNNLPLNLFIIYLFFFLIRIILLCFLNTVGFSEAAVNRKYRTMVYCKTIVNCKSFKAQFHTFEQSCLQVRNIVSS